MDAIHRHATARHVDDSLNRLAQWVQAQSYRAYDPGDGQRSYLRKLTFGQARLERLLTAAVLRMPWNLRPLLGITPHTSSKGMGYMAWGYLKRYADTRNTEHADHANACLQWLLDHRAQGQAHACWGNAFTFTTRAGRIPQDTPTIVWSSLIGQAFVEAFHVTGQRSYLDVAESVCEWICTLPRTRTATGDCLSYGAYAEVPIHNSNLLGAALLARVGQAAQRADFLTVAQSAVQYSCTRQHDDGAWAYGEDPKYAWIDNFHTGYNLDSVRRYAQATGDTQFNTALLKGYAYFKANFFEPDGAPKYMHNRALPYDIQCAAQAIDTLCFFADDDPQALTLAVRTAQWTMQHMQAPVGYFYYRKLRRMTIKTPMLHWGQGTMFKALAHLAQALRQQEDAANQPHGEAQAKPSHRPPRHPPQQVHA
jgi:hypothetical protein